METIEKNAEVLNDLIEINNDRIKGYERAVGETAEGDAELRDLFIELANESKANIYELREQVQRAGEDPAEGTTASGKIYRTWMDVKSLITGHDRKAILASCEFGEDAAQRAYGSALEEESLSGELKSLISEQRSKLKLSHDKIKSMRDAE
ncbi:MAG: PA2169 family four-helix-bundle protein [Saprospiraceae bacterium]